jgi:leucyl-tRNA synthetase
MQMQNLFATVVSLRLWLEVEKMSKSKYNVVNPDVLIGKYGADALRLYEMFLGPLEQYKPWNTNGISGVGSFLKKFWRLFHPEDGPLAVTDERPAPPSSRLCTRPSKRCRKTSTSSASTPPLACS